MLQLGQAHAVVRGLRDEYEALASARRQWQEKAEAKVMELPPPLQEITRSMIAREFPSESASSPAPTPAHAASKDSPGGGLRRALQALAPDLPVDAPGAEEALQQRVCELLRVLAQTFVELQNGHARFEQELGVRVIKEFGTLNAAHDPQQVLAYLLDTSRSDTQPVRELSRSYSDFMLHQVALLNGVMAGAHGLLGHLAPDEIRRLADGKDRDAALWQRFVEHYETLSEAQRVAQILFGEEFLHTYNQVGSQLPPDSDR